jgi:ABC-type sugar transport system permease subunit
MIWQRMFDYQRGIINEFIVIFGGQKIDWFKDPTVYMLIFLLVQAWHAPGYGIIMYNAAFTSIDTTLYEAARIDGASRIKQFTSITLPAISPTTYFLLMLGIISGLQQFEIFQVFTGLAGSWTGAFGPSDMGLVPLLYIYSLKDTQIAQASSMSWFLFFIVFTTSKLNEKLQKVWVANENE